jgi:hypothetical protein
MNLVISKEASATELIYKADIKYGSIAPTINPDNYKGLRILTL